MIPAPASPGQPPMAHPSRNNPSSGALKCWAILIVLGAIVYNLTMAPASSGQKRTPKAPAKPTPTPSSNVQRMGPPPPIPVLRKKPEEVRPSDVISVETTEVMLPVTVRDANGR